MPTVSVASYAQTFVKYGSAWNASAESKGINWKTSSTLKMPGSAGKLVAVTTLENGAFSSNGDWTANVATGTGERFQIKCTQSSCQKGKNGTWADEPSANMYNPKYYVFAPDTVDYFTSACTGVTCVPSIKKTKSGMQFTLKVGTGNMTRTEIFTFGKNTINSSTFTSGMKVTARAALKP